MADRGVDDYLAVLGVERLDDGEAVLRGDALDGLEHLGEGSILGLEGRVHAIGVDVADVIQEGDQVGVGIVGGGAHVGGGN